MLIKSPANYQREDKMLAPYAVKSGQSKGRQHPEEEDPFRTPFQRDRDRIIHSKAFRRLKGKTQVFVAHFGDHFRSRLSHSIEVAQLARDISRGLGLNEDLTESLALAHDLGHTPFGHAGEEALNEVMSKFSGHFEHNEQSLRIVEKLEIRYPNFPGLNLSYETTEGLKKHKKWSEREFSLEAQVVDKADAIAYHNHDIDDGLRAGILSLKQLENLDLWKEAVSDVDPSLSDEVYQISAINNLISLMISDLYFETERRLVENNVRSIGDVYGSHKQLVGFSTELQEKIDQVAEFLGQHFYFHEAVYTQSARGQKIIKALFSIFSDKEKLLPIEERKRLEKEERHEVIKDYIAGMTDEYAEELLEELK
jgi:dGTPase